MILEPTEAQAFILAGLMDGRQVLAQEPSAIEVALRDTRSYSVFLDSESDSALTVVGRTDRLRDLFGGSGVYVETGVVEYVGHYICDGLFRTLASLGPHYRHSFNESYAAIRDAGRFQRRPEATA